MKLSITVGSTSQTVNILVLDSSSTSGAGLTGLVYNSGSLVAYYVLPRAAAAAITLATQTVTGAYSSGGFVEISSSNVPGLYRLDIPDAALASGRFVTIMLKGAANMAPVALEIELTGWNNQDAVHGGMSALPNTACTTNASLLTSGTGTDQLSVSSGRIDAGKWLGGTIPAVNVTGVPKVDLVDWLGSAPNALSSGNVPTTAGDPWDTALPGAYSSGKAGYLLGTYVNASIAAVKAKTDSLTFTVSNQVDANTLKIGGTTQTARDLGASVLVSSGTGTGQISLSAGRIKVQTNTVTNVALSNFMFVMVDSAGIPRTGLTVTAARVIDGGSASACANSVSEVSNGIYRIDLATSDLNGAVIALRFTATGAQDRVITVVMTP
jgi:hypothetical protein